MQNSAHASAYHKNKKCCHLIHALMSHAIDLWTLQKGKKKRKRDKPVVHCL